MNAIIFKEMLQLIEIGLKSDLKSEKHSCLYRLACNFNLLVGSSVINLNEIKLATRGPNRLDLLRIEMKSLLLQFNQDVGQRASKVAQDTQQEIKLELESVAAIFAEKYRKLQLKYMNLLFREDLEKMVGKDKVDLFTRFEMSQNASNN